MRYILIKTSNEYYIIMTTESEEMLVLSYINNMRKRYEISKILSEISSIYDVKYSKIKNVIEVIK